VQKETLNAGCDDATVSVLPRTLKLLSRWSTNQVRKMKTRSMIIALTTALCACSSGFSDSDIGAVEKKIRTHFEQQGQHVLEINFEKTSETHLTGYAVLDASSLSSKSHPTIRTTCEAMMAENGAVAWKCY
jgi:hypothetical protein